MIDCMGKYYLRQMIFLVLYIWEHICVIKKISLKVGFKFRLNDIPHLAFFVKWSYKILQIYFTPLYICSFQRNTELDKIMGEMSVSGASSKHEDLLDLMDSTQKKK